MSLGTIHYGKESIRYHVLYCSRKTLAIEVHPDSSVVIKAPKATSLDEIQLKVSKRARWVIKQLQYFHQFEPRTPERCFIGGETHLYLGKQFRLKVSEAGKDSVKLLRGYFVVETSTSAHPDKVRLLLERWYGEKAASIFQESFEGCWRHFEPLGLARPQMKIRRMKKRWGSLSSNGQLTLNTDLIRAPKECIEYVITHELCHLQCHDHSGDFYSLLEKMMPDWEKRKHKLELALV
ncbi:M48 family metallopeptidase [Trichlorobacter lovleyi]|uniref:M48 family metallopeptidase n=1 Tax=Trichlorobacter lovleyi TaxID=313985 RepID=UPI00223F2ED3|nr:SprT family zinc-dependent metalloprotease [Trichlorobacter lovleyi]QOX80480.1 M48 family metallopeptidase [Trichlorobacter lovleyi]